MNPGLKNFFRICSVLFCLGALCGCETIQPKQTSSSGVLSPSPAQSSAPGHNPAAFTFVLPEIVASAPVEGASQPYQNIHAHLELTLWKAENAGRSADAIEEARRVLAPRVASELLRTMSEGKILSARNLGLLRETLASQAGSVVEKWLAENPSAGISRGEAVVVSLYFTGPSIGRGPAH